MNLPRSPSRRRFLVASAAALPALAAHPLRADAIVTAGSLGLVPDGSDQTERFRSALIEAAAHGQTLLLEPGEYHVGRIELPDGAAIDGAGRATLIDIAGNGVFGATDLRDISISGIALTGTPKVPDATALQVMNCRYFALADCAVSGFGADGIRAENSSVRISNSRFWAMGETAVHLQDCRDSLVADNVISDCGNGGVRVWRYQPGFDGSIVKDNQISNIRSGSGNGQNGNGVNVFQADHVVVSGNVISDCDFSAVRTNSSRNTIISTNNCRQLREVGIFSEFAFSGSIIADNVIDEAATGISITNLDDDGHLATCSGNVVRNIMPFSPTNPDTLPIGIHVEAETAIAGNVIEGVPGVSINAGWGRFLRNVLISSNMLRDADVGIGVSIVDGAGRCHIANNLITDMRVAPIVGFEWTEPRDVRLAETWMDYPNLSISDNQIS